MTSNIQINFNEFQKLLTECFNSPNPQNQMKMNDMIITADLTEVLNFFQSQQMNSMFKCDPLLEILFVLFIEKMMKRQSKTVSIDHIKIIYFIIMSSDQHPLYHEKSLDRILELFKFSAGIIDIKDKFTMVNALLVELGNEIEKETKIRLSLKLLGIILAIKTNSEEFNVIYSTIYQILSKIATLSISKLLSEQKIAFIDIIVLSMKNLVFLIKHNINLKYSFDYQCHISDLIVPTLSFLLSQPVLFNLPSTNISTIKAVKYALKLILIIDMKFPQLIYLDASTVKNYHLKLVKHIVLNITSLIQSKKEMNDILNSQHNSLNYAIIFRMLIYLHHSLMNKIIMAQYSSDIFQLVTRMILPIMNTSTLLLKTNDQYNSLYYSIGSICDIEYARDVKETKKNKYDDVLSISMAMLKMIVDKYPVAVDVCNYIMNIFDKATEGNDIAFCLFVLCGMASKIKTTSALSAIVSKKLREQLPLLYKIELTEDNLLLNLFTCYCVDRYIFYLYSKTGKEVALTLSWLFNSIEQSHFSMMTFNELFIRAMKDENSKTFFSEFVSRKMPEIIENISITNDISYLDFVMLLVKKIIMSISIVDCKTSFCELIFENISKKINDEIEAATKEDISKGIGAKREQVISLCFKILDKLFITDKTQEKKYYITIESIICQKLLKWIYLIDKVSIEDNLIGVVSSYLDASKSITNDEMFSLLHVVVKIIKKNEGMPLNLYECVIKYILFSSSIQKEKYVTQDILAIYKKIVTLSKGTWQLEMMRNLLIANTFTMADEIGSNAIFDILSYTYESFWKLFSNIDYENQVNMALILTNINALLSAYYKNSQLIMDVINRNNTYQSFINAINSVIESTQYVFAKIYKPITFSLYSIVNHRIYKEDSRIILKIAFKCMASQLSTESSYYKEKYHVESNFVSQDDDDEEDINNEKKEDSDISHEINEIIDRTYYDTAFDEYFLFNKVVENFNNSYPEEYAALINSLNPEEKFCFGELLKTKRVQVKVDENKVIYPPRKIVKIKRERQVNN